MVSIHSQMDCFDLKRQEINKNGGRKIIKSLDSEFLFTWSLNCCYCCLLCCLPTPLMCGLAALLLQLLLCWSVACPSTVTTRPAVVLAGCLYWLLLPPHCCLLLLLCCLPLPTSPICCLGAPPRLLGTSVAPAPLLPAAAPNHLLAWTEGCTT